MTPKHRNWTAPLGWLAAGLFLLPTFPAAAGDAPAPAADEARNETPRQSAPPAAAGLTIFVDPETGELTDRPTAEQKAALAQALNSSLSKSSGGLAAFELRGGGHGVHLQGRFQSAAIARVRPDGSFEIRCVDHPGAAAVLLTEPPAAAEWEEK